MAERGIYSKSLISLEDFEKGRFADPNLRHKFLEMKHKGKPSPLHGLATPNAGFESVVGLKDTHHPTWHGEIEHIRRTASFKPPPPRRKKAKAEKKEREFHHRARWEKYLSSKPGGGEG